MAQIIWGDAGDGQNSADQYQQGPGGGRNATTMPDQSGQSDPGFDAFWGAAAQPPAAQPPPAYTPPPEQSSPWGGSFAQDIGGGTNANPQQPAPYGGSFVRDIGGGTNAPGGRQPPPDQYTSQIQQLQQQLQQLQQQLQQYQGGGQQPPPPQQPPYPDNFNLFNPSGDQGYATIEPWMRGNQGYPYQGGGNQGGPSGMYGPGGRQGGDVLTSDMGMRLRRNPGYYTTPDGQQGYDQQGTGGYGQPAPQQSQSPMSYQPPPWAQSVLSGQRLPSFVGFGDYAPLPSPQVWGGMSPMEQNANMQIAQSQGIDPATYSKYLQASWPDANWGYRGPARYQS